MIGVRGCVCVGSRDGWSAAQPNARCVVYLSRIIFRVRRARCCCVELLLFAASAILCKLFSCDDGGIKEWGRQTILTPRSIANNALLLAHTMTTPMLETKKQRDKSEANAHRYRTARAITFTKHLHFYLLNEVNLCLLFVSRSVGRSVGLLCFVCGVIVAKCAILKKRQHRFAFTQPFPLLYALDSLHIVECADARIPFMATQTVLATAAAAHRSSFPAKKKR